MNTDIRIITSFKDHPKRIKLEMILGKEGTSYLIDLWISTAVNRPDGILVEWDELDIAIAAGWRKDPIVFCNALIDCKFLKKKKGVYILHDWDEHQGWACGAKQRSEHARIAAKARWDDKTKTKSIPEQGNSGAQKMPKQCNDDARAMPEHTLSNAPNPNPNPNPNPRPNPKPNIRATPPAKDGYLATDYSKIWYDVTGGKIPIGKNTKIWKELQVAFGKERTLAGWKKYCEEIYRQGRESFASAADYARSPKKYMFPKKQQRWGVTA